MGNTVQEIRDTSMKKIYEVQQKIQEKSQEESCKMSNNDDCAIRVSDFNRESEEQNYWEEKSMMRYRREKCASQ